jgi:squalene cyclase
MRLVLPFLAGALIVAALPASAPASDKEALRQSISKSMALLDKAQLKFERQATCASCHNQVEPMVAAVAARGKGLAVNEAVYRRQLASTAEVIKLRRDYMMGHGVAGGAHVVVAALLQGLSETSYPADEDTDTAVMFLIAKQSPSGAWQTVNVRAPHTMTSFYTTANSVRAIDAYAPPALRKDADASIAKARAWLLATPAGADNDALTYRLQGLVWAKAAKADVAKAARELAASQKPDGGWAQYPQMASDAYATGQSLIALQKAGMKPADPVYQRGLDYLLKTQAADGSWYVKAHALPIQPPIDSGFPYGHDQWISSWATAYAISAMAYAL